MPRSSEQFQSTHPLRGATNVIVTGLRGRGISIHAPLAGCDEKQMFVREKELYFNPRTPCGVRRLRQLFDNHGIDFNPRTPCGVRLIIPVYRDRRL